MKRIEQKQLLPPTKKTLWMYITYKYISMVPSSSFRPLVCSPHIPSDPIPAVCVCVCVCVCIWDREREREREWGILKNVTSDLHVPIGIAFREQPMESHGWGSSSVLFLFYRMPLQLTFHLITYIYYIYTFNVHLMNENLLYVLVSSSGDFLLFW